MPTINTRGAASARAFGFSGVAAIAPTPPGPIAGTGYALNITAKTIQKITGSGTVATFATLPNTPDNICVDPFNNVWVSSSAASVVAKFNSSGTNTANYSVAGSAIASDGSGNIFVLSGANLNKISSGGTITNSFITEAGSPANVKADSSGNIFISNFGGTSLTKYNSSGAQTNYYGLYGRGVPLVIDSANNCYAANIDNGTMIKVNSSGVDTSPWASVTNGVSAMAVDSHSNVYVGNGSDISKVTSAGVVTQSWATLSGVSSIIVDSNNYVYAISSSGNTIIQVTPSQIVTSSFATVTNNGAPLAYSPV